MRSDGSLQVGWQDISVQVAPIHDPQQMAPGQSEGPSQASSTSPPPQVRAGAQPTCCWFTGS
jgi:hypothetical protein